MLNVTTIGRGRPIVVLPGFGLDSAVMAAAFEPAFNAGDWQRLYLDLPGHRGSPPVEPTSDAVLIAIRATISASLGEEQPFLIAGHSYGGYLGAGLVRRWPERVAGLLTVCAGVRIERDRRDLTGVSPPEPEPGWLAAVPAPLHQHFERAIGRQTRDVADRVAAAFAVLGPQQEDYLDQLQSTGYRLSDQDTSRRFDGPVSLLAGRCDQMVGYADQFATLAHYPHASFTAVAEAGHYLPFEQPELFAALVRDWLARVRTGQPQISP